MDTAAEGRRRGRDGEVPGEGGEGDMPEVLQEGVKRMSLAAPLLERPQQVQLEQRGGDRDAFGAPPGGQAGRNRVLEDGIMKERVQLQEVTRRAWQKKWGFLADQELVFKQETAAARVDHRRCKAGQGARGSAGADPLRHVSVLPSPPIPRVSSGLVGWRSSQPQLTLERVGALYRSPLRTIDPPQEPGDLPRGRQSFIFLG